MESVLIISIDTLRADHLGCYGYSRATSPNIDRLASESALYEHAFATCSYTVPSFTSMMTSRYSSWHTAKFQNQASRQLAPEMTPLAELMAIHGYRTGAFVSTVVLSAQNCGLDRGFEVYDEDTTISELNRPGFLYRRAESTVKKAGEWLESIGDEPFFMWVHFMDVHGPYDPPPSHKNKFINDGLAVTPFDNLHLPIIPTANAVEVCPGQYISGIPSYQVLGYKEYEDDRFEYESCFRTYLDSYDGAINYADLGVGRLLSHLKKNNRYDDTSILLHSDHGEALGEKGVFFYHGLNLTPDQIHIPLLIKSPRLEPGRSPNPVSLVDIMPFLVDALDLDPPENMMGRSLLAPLDENRLIPAQILRQLGVVSNENLYLFGKGWFEKSGGMLFESPDWQKFMDGCLPPDKYDFKNDPTCLSSMPVSKDDNHVLKWVLEFVEKANQQTFESEPLVKDEAGAEKLAQRLKALGYVE